MGTANNSSPVWWQTWVNGGHYGGIVTFPVANPFLQDEDPNLQPRADALASLCFRVCMHMLWKSGDDVLLFNTATNAPHFLLQGWMDLFIGLFWHVQPGWPQMCISNFLRSNWSDLTQKNWTHNLQVNVLWKFSAKWSMNWEAGLAAKVEMHHVLCAWESSKTWCDNQSISGGWVIATLSRLSQPLVGKRTFCSLLLSCITLHGASSQNSANATQPNGCSGECGSPLQRLVTDTLALMIIEAHKMCSREMQGSFPRRCPLRAKHHISLHQRLLQLHL